MGGHALTETLNREPDYCNVLIISQTWTQEAALTLDQKRHSFLKDDRPACACLSERCKNDECHALKGPYLLDKLG